MQKNVQNFEQNLFTFEMFLSNICPLFMDLLHKLFKAIHKCQNLFSRGYNKTCCKLTFPRCLLSLG